MIESLAARPVVTADRDEDVRSVAIKMRDGHVGCVVIVDGRRPVGIVTDRDLALRVLADAMPSSTSVGHVMTADPAVVELGSSVEVVLRTMRGAGTRRMPVVDARGDLVGIVTHDDLLVVFAREISALGEGVEAGVDSRELR
jgi:CBS domain-containing protein